MAESGRAVLRRTVEPLEDEVPERLARQIFGGKKATMLEMSKHLARHPAS